MPSWQDFAALVSGPDIGDSELAAPWITGNESAFWFSRSVWAMEAILSSWQAAKPSRRPVVWLPDYFCNQSTWSLRQSDAKLVFYPIGSDFQPKWPECTTMAEAEPPDLFFLVHYFGSPANARRAREFCDRTEATLIEDAAHALGPCDGIGGFGDFVFYSPHKIMAVPDGGLLLIRRHDDEGRNAIYTDQSRHKPPCPGLWMAKRIVQKTLPDFALNMLAARRRPDFTDDPPFQDICRKTRISGVARRMIAAQSDKLALIATTRRDNAVRLARAVEGIKGCRPAFTMDENGDMVPYRFVLRFDDKDAANAYFRKIQARKCPVESWPDLPPEVTSAPEIHADAIKLRRTLVLLPLHHSVPVEELCRVLADYS